jgi:hypothetical protein
MQRNLQAMEVHLAPELHAKIDQLVIETGCPVEKQIEDALAGTFRNLRGPAKCSTAVMKI